MSNGQLRHVLYNNQSGEENRNRAETFIKVITKEVCSLVLLAMPMEEKQRETQKVCASGEQGNDGQRGLAEKQKEEEKATESNRRGKMDQARWIVSAQFRPVQYRKSSQVSFPSRAS